MYTLDLYHFVLIKFLDTDRRRPCLCCHIHPRNLLTHTLFCQFLENLNLDLKSTLDYIRTMFFDSTRIFFQKQQTINIYDIENESRKFSILQTNQYHCFLTPPLVL